MNHPATKLLTAVQPAGIAVGFSARTLLNNEPPVNIAPQLNTFSWVWSFALIGMCVVAAGLAYAPDREGVIKLRASLDFILAVWVALITVAIFARPQEPGEKLWSSTWWSDRDYTTTAAAFAVSMFFLYFWWDQIHFRLPRLRVLDDFRGTLDRLEREIH